MSSIQKRPSGRYRARYRGPDGREHARHFDRKVDAQRWLDEITAAVVTGQYVDPRAGRVTFREYAELWRERKANHRATTRAHVETMLRRHVYPVLGDRALSSILPGDVESLVAAMSRTLAPSTVRVVHGIVASIFRAAVRDRKVAASPCESTDNLPRKVSRRKVEPLSTGAVRALAGAVPAHLRALVVLAAGTGMRQGECLGLTLDRVDFLRRALTVDRQLVTVQGAPPFLGPPKTSASVRTIPLPQVVVDELAAHAAVTRPLEVDVEDQSGALPVSVRVALLFSLDDGPVRRTALSGRVWRPAVRAAGLPSGTRFHDLRHYYASLLIRHGESVKTVQARLGHASAQETLDTYAHLWPDSDDRTRDAVDAVLGTPADSLRTAEGGER